MNLLWKLMIYEAVLAVLLFAITSKEARHGTCSYWTVCWKKPASDCISTMEALQGRLALHELV